MGKSWIDRKCTGMGNPHGSLPCGTLRGPSASSQLQCPSENAPKVLLNQKLSYFLFWVLGWVPKNWCFWTVVLEKTFESPLGCKRSNQSILNEISPDYSLEWLMLKLKLQYFGHLMQRADSLEKTLILGRIEGKRRRGQQRMRWLDNITNLMEVNLNKLKEIVKGRKAWHAAVHGSQTVRQLSDRTTIFPMLYKISLHLILY